MAWQRILIFALAALSLVALERASLDAQGTTPAAPSTGEFEVDTTHSMALFKVKHMGVGNFYGRFNDVKGKIVLTESEESPVSAEIMIAVGSIDTGVEKLDNHLKSADFFDVEKHPDMGFKSSSSKKTGENLFEVTGELTIHGVTKTVTAKVEHSGIQETPRGVRTGFETTFTIKRSDFGMEYGIANKAVSDETKVIVSIEAIVPSTGDRPERPGRRGGMKERLMGFDKNKDGKLEKSEVPESMVGFFERLDANKDGFIDEKEMDNPPARPVGGGRRDR